MIKITKQQFHEKRSAKQSKNQELLDRVNELQKNEALRFESSEWNRSYHPAGYFGIYFKRYKKKFSTKKVREGGNIVYYILRIK